MVIHKIKSEDFKGDQQWQMVWNCTDQWCKLNDANFSHYPYIMNSETYRYNVEHDCYVSITHHFNPNKW